MLSQLGKSVLTAAVVTLAPVAPAMFGTASDASAHTYVSGSISFGRPYVPVPVPQVAVVGFSYGNPYLYGPVYYEPESCHFSQVYYYPRYRVWAPRYSGFRYYSYERPRYYRRGPAHHIRGHAYGHDNRRYHRGSEGRRYVRGHGRYDD